MKSVIFDKTGTLFTKIDHIESFTLLWKNETEFYSRKEIDKTLQKQKQHERPLVLSDPIETKRDEVCQSMTESKLKYNTTLTVADLWAIIGVLERDFKHPLANLLFKESIKRQLGQQSTFKLTELPQLTPTGIIGQVTRMVD